MHVPIAKVNQLTKAVGVHGGRNQWAKEKLSKVSNIRIKRYNGSGKTNDDAELQPETHEEEFDDHDSTTKEVSHRASRNRAKYKTERSRLRKGLNFKIEQVYERQEYIVEMHSSDGKHELFRWAKHLTFTEAADLFIKKFNVPPSVKKDEIAADLEATVVSSPLKCQLNVIWIGKLNDKTTIRIDIDLGGGRGTQSIFISSRRNLGQVANDFCTKHFVPKRFHKKVLGILKRSTSCFSPSFEMTKKFEKLDLDSTKQHSDNNNQEEEEDCDDNNKVSDDSLKVTKTPSNDTPEQQQPVVEKEDLESNNQKKNTLLEIDSKTTFFKDKEDDSNDNNTTLKKTETPEEDVESNQQEHEAENDIAASDKEASSRFYRPNSDQEVLYRYDIDTNNLFLEFMGSIEGPLNIKTMDDLFIKTKRFCKNHESLKTNDTLLGLFHALRRDFKDRILSEEWLRHISAFANDSRADRNKALREHRITVSKKCINFECNDDIWAFKMAASLRSDKSQRTRHFNTFRFRTDQKIQDFIKNTSGPLNIGYRNKAKKVFY